MTLLHDEIDESVQVLDSIEEFGFAIIFDFVTDFRGSFSEKCYQIDSGFLLNY